MSNDVDEAVRKTVGAIGAFIIGGAVFLLVLMGLFALGPEYALAVGALGALIALFVGASNQSLQ